MSLRTTLTTAGVAALAALLTAAVPATAQAVQHDAASHSRTSHGTYVALGSSYAAGSHGLTPLDPTDVDGGCARSTSTYPKMVAAALDLDLVDVSCSGSTTANITTTPQQVVGSNGPRTVAPQIAAVTADTDLVTITTGGNDVGYIGGLMSESCQADLATNPGSPLGTMLAGYGICAPTSDARTAAAFKGLQSSIESVVDAVHARAPHARVVLVEYLTVVPQDAQGCDLLPLPADRLEHYASVAHQLARTTERAARASGAQVVRTDLFSRQHDACSAHPWVTGYSATGALMHPNVTGHRAVAAAVAGQVVLSSLR